MIITALGVVLFFYAYNLRRANRRIEFSLQKNCLLTKNPICFIPGRRNPLYFLNYWNNIPKYLLEHGYSLVSYRPRPIHFFNRKKMVRKFIEAQTRPMHFVFDDELIKEILPIKKPLGHSFHIFKEGSPLGLPHYKEEAPLTPHLQDSPLSFATAMNQLQESPDYSPNHRTAKIQPNLYIHKIPVEEKGRNQAPFLFNSVKYKLSPLQTKKVLGTESKAINLTVEPHYLSSFRQIAEQEWV